MRNFEPSYRLHDQTNMVKQGVFDGLTLSLCYRLTVGDVGERGTKSAACISRS